MFDWILNMPLTILYWMSQERLLIVIFGTRIYLRLLFLFKILGKATDSNIDGFCATLYIALKGDKRDQVFKNGPIKTCGRQPLKNLLGSFLNTLSQMPSYYYKDSNLSQRMCQISCQGKKIWYCALLIDRVPGSIFEISSFDFNQSYW